ncbi:MAG: chemotaxis protein CheW [Halobacteriota archaeon]
MAAVAAYQVLEFELGGKRYCVALEAVDEIVTNENDITEIPQAPAEVVGVTDLRGETTTIIDPRLALGLSTGTEAKYVVVFATDEEPIGWLIEDVSQVAAHEETGLDESVATDAVNGVFKRDETFSIWVDPASIHDTALEAT